MNEQLIVVGQPVRRVDAPDKVKGTAKYVDDLAFTGMLFAHVLRSSLPHAEIVKIDISKTSKINGVIGIYTANDIPGNNLIPLIQQDQPLLADKKANHIGEGIALIAAESARAAKNVADKIKVTYKKLNPILTIEEAFKQKDIFTHWTIIRGNVNTVFQDPENIIIEDTYHTPYQEHAYLETNGMIAMPDGMGGIIIYGSLQCPFYVQNAVASVLGIPLSKVRIIQMATGGGFGGKEDAPSLPGSMAALMAWKTGRPVKLIFNREEDMDCMSKRHPAKIRYKSAVSKDGILKGIEVDYFLNGGAYATLSPVVLWRGALHAGGPYRIPNVMVNAYAVRTNTVPCGAFRGFGEPQIVFAAESQIDRLAEKVGINPLEFRLKNFLDVGDETITGQKIETSFGLREVVEKIITKADWHYKYSNYNISSSDKHSSLPCHILTHYQQVTNNISFSEEHSSLPSSQINVLLKPPSSTKKRGIGIACTYYGVGLGARGKHLNPAGANVIVYPDGSVSIAVGTTELGQGMYTVLAQIAAETLCCPLEVVKFVEPDTSRVPDSGPTVASRTTVMSGNAIKDACLTIKSRMKDALCENSFIDKISFKDAVKECIAKQVHLAAQGWAVPPHTTFDEKTGQGDPYITYTWSANIVEVEIDIETCEVKVIQVVSGHDIGKVINPKTGEGQIEGGVVQGLGYALTEEHFIKNGKILNNQFSNYIIPAAPDIPEIIPVIVEHPFQWGPYGAKGLGETPLIGVAPAVTNAIANAVGVRLTEIPATPERIWEKLQKPNNHTQTFKVDSKSIYSLDDQNHE